MLESRDALLTSLLNVPREEHANPADLADELRQSQVEHEDQYAEPHEHR